MRLKWLGALLAVFVLGVALGGGLAAWSATVPPSPLTAGLPSRWDAASRMFDRRVRARFPAGTPAAALASVLAREGFAADWTGADGESAAVRDESGFVCRVAARIFYRIDGAGRIAAIRGIYREEGCL